MNPQEIPEAMGGKLVMAGGFCAPNGDNIYDIKPLVEQVVEECLKDDRPWSVRGGIKFTCGTAVRALWQMEVNDASKEGAAEPDERPR